MPPIREKTFLEFYDFTQAWQQTFTALKGWIIVEAICFGLLPALKLIDTRVRMDGWFIPSIIAGLVGAGLLGLSSELLRVVEDRLSGTQKKPLILLGRIASLVGIAGVGLPLFLVGAEVWMYFTVNSKKPL
uniref:Uncharacterized protein n=1 Tax=Cyanothece sp. (strain PCC 7425 / ATCC 29141) TaxID=395961 RepID=B8HVI9_CYAP4